jgi:hypothetical protein
MKMHVDNLTALLACAANGELHLELTLHINELLGLTLHTRFGQLPKLILR